VIKIWKGGVAMEFAAPRDPLTISRESFHGQSDATAASLNASVEQSTRRKR